MERVPVRVTERRMLRKMKMCNEGVGIVVWNTELLCGRGVFEERLPSF